MSMTLREVDAFRTIILSGSMTAAAIELRTSQPSISRLISELEEKIGLKLFDRKAGRISPTLAGLTFYQEVDRSYVGMQTLEMAAKEIRYFGTGRLRLAAMPVVAFGFLPRCIKRFKDHYPSAVISLQMGNDGAVSRWMASSFCDIGFVANVISIPNIDSRWLYSVPGVCALPKGHVIAEKDVITPQDLDGEPFISLSVEDGTRARVDRMFDELDVKRHLTIETPYSSAICALVDQGLGVGIVNPIAAADYKGNNIVFRHLQPEMLFHGHAIFSPQKSNDPMVEHFLSLVKEELLEMDPMLVKSALL